MDTKTLADKKGGGCVTVREVHRGQVTSEHKKPGGSNTNYQDGGQKGALAQEYCKTFVFGNLIFFTSV